MGTKEDIENKLFDYALSTSISKLRLVQDLLKHGFGDVELDPEDVYACGVIVDDVVFDMDEIREELLKSNGSKAPPEPDTAPISAEEG